jgi:predicted site-specific integrase-resolvase
MNPTLPNLFAIGRLTQRYGLCAQTIRNWERQGMIPPTLRTAGGHRRYNLDHVRAIDALLLPVETAAIQYTDSPCQVRFAQA